MPLFLIPILVLIGAFLFSAKDTLLTQVSTQVKEFRLFPEASEKKAPLPVVAPIKPAAIKGVTPAGTPAILETQITVGPENGSVLTDSFRVSFSFSGSSSAPGTLSFETRLLGAETAWQETKGRSRSITLPRGTAIYTFQVRSKLGNQTDATPAFRAFRASVSHYYGKIKIDSIKTGNPSLITLAPKLSAGETINLTGWTLKGKAGQYTIPMGVRLVPPGFSSALKENIVATSQDKILLSSARGPFGVGVNFRPNDCMGYIKNQFVFPIAIAGSCSVRKPSEYELLYFSRTCQNYLLKTLNYSSCVPPDYSKISAIAFDLECARYIDAIQPEFTYQGCVLRKESTPGFIKNDWHIYMNTNLPIQRFDAIELRDADGLLVDLKTY